MKMRHIIQGLVLLWILIAVFLLNHNIEAWCPMGGIECLYSYFVEGTMLCSLQVTNFFMLAGVVLLALCLKRVFCGYLCPLGTIAEVMRVMAKKVGFRQISIPPAVLKILSVLKYLVLAVILGWTWHAGELIIRGVDPCYAVLTRGEEALWTTYAVLVLFVLSAFFISMPFCRWLCPLAAGMNIFSRFGMARITKNPEACNDCGACTKACPMGIQVASMEQVKSADCIACMECVSQCPRRPNKALQWKWFGRIGIAHPQRVIFVGLAVCLAAVYLASFLIPFSFFNYQREGYPPQETTTCHMQVEGVACGGSAKLFVYYLERKDFNQIPGYLKVSMFPSTGYVDVKIEYDPKQTSQEAIQDAIVEPYFEEQENRWRPSPFRIKDHDFNSI